MEAQMGPEGQFLYPQKMKTMDSKRPVRNLAEKIHSLLGFKEQLTSNWVSAVRNIIKTLPSEGSAVDLEPHKDVDLGTSVSKIKDELALLTVHINQLNIQRRQVLNDLLDLKGNIRVFCRIRPISTGESFGRLRPVVAMGSSNVLLKLADNKSKSYSFDKVFNPGSSQDEVFSEVEPVIKSALDGYNACIFAYGQTGTGKTFTMEGTREFPGVVPRAIEALFQQAVDSNHAFVFSFSMVEIYMGNLRDLLVQQPTKLTDPIPPCLSIQTDPKGGIEIENLVGIQVSDLNQVLRLYRLGCRFRSTASTNSNMTSSRSHCMIRISITCFNAPERRREMNKVWLVDLGGSERVLKTKASGKRLEEGKAINLSLSALGDVINALQRRKTHIPYRNSKLTQVLKDSLGEDSKTLMLVHVSPREDDLCETICSLNFAARARSIHLGRIDSTEITGQRNSAMMNLQQKLNRIEDERQDVRKKIQKLNQKLENLTKTTTSSSNELLDESEPHYDLDTTKSKNEGVKSAKSSQLPRFMRPTICSRRKSGTALIDKNTVPVRRRRRAASQCAASVTFPVKPGSEFASTSTISRTSCLTTLNRICVADNETECSQSEAGIDNVQTLLKEFFDKASKPNSISIACRGSDIEDNGDQVSRTSTVHDDETQCSKCFTPNHSDDAGDCSQSDQHFIDQLKENFGFCDANPELVSYSLPRSQRALFKDDPKQETMIMSFVEENVHTTGICNLLKEKIQIVSGSVLLGLGFQSLGFDHDFFNGLLL